jgi:integrase
LIAAIVSIHLPSFYGFLCIIKQGAIGKWMRRLCDEAKVKRFGLHAIRHLTASILAKANVPMVDIQAVLRHKKLSTTERHIGRIDSLRPSLEVLPGIKKPFKEPPTKKGLQLIQL